MQTTLFSSALQQRKHFRTGSDWARCVLCRALNRFGRATGLRRKVPLRVHLCDLQHPLYIRSATTDYDVFKQVFLEGEYEFLCRLSHRRMETVIDLGANIGLFTRFAGQMWPEARILAVEPDAGNAAQLRANIVAGRLTETVRVYQTCVAGEGRVVGLDRTGGEWGYRMTEAAEGIQGSMRAITVPELLADLGSDSVDLLKCDIEGAERELFAQCAPWINRVRTLVVETHGSYTPSVLREALEDNGSRLVHRETQDKGFGMNVVVLSADA